MGCLVWKAERNRQNYCFLTSKQCHTEETKTKRKKNKGRVGHSSVLRLGGQSKLWHWRCKWRCRSFPLTPKKIPDKRVPWKKNTIFHLLLYWEVLFFRGENALGEPCRAFWRKEIFASTSLKNTIKPEWMHVEWKRNGWLTDYISCLLICLLMQTPIYRQWGSL